MSSDVVGPLLLELLGVPAEGVVAASVLLRAGEPVRVFTERIGVMPMGIDESLTEMKSVMTEYEVVEK